MCHKQKLLLGTLVIHACGYDSLQSLSPQHQCHVTRTVRELGCVITLMRAALGVNGSACVAVSMPPVADVKQFSTESPFPQLHKGWDQRCPPAFFLPLPGTNTWGTDYANQCCLHSFLLPFTIEKCTITTGYLTLSMCSPVTHPSASLYNFRHYHCQIFHPYSDHK